MREKLAIKSIELLILWAAVKPKRLHECDETGESSLCVNYLVKLMDSIPNSE